MIRFSFMPRKKKAVKVKAERQIVVAPNGGASIVEGGKVIKSFRNEEEAKKEL